MTKGRIARFFHPVTISRYELLPAEFHFSRNKLCGPADRSVDDLDQSHGAAELLSETYYLVVK